MHETMLAAVVYDHARGDEIDATFGKLAAELVRHGVALAGAQQVRRVHAGSSACDLMLHDFGSGQDVLISENRGPMARGCRLDPAALDSAVALALAALDDGAQLLIVNRFGKQELEGGGYRVAIATAVAEGVPTLVGVSAERIADWRTFAADSASELNCDAGAIRAWLNDAGLGASGPARGAIELGLGAAD